MKAAGFLCNVDGLGRIVIPKQLRNQLELPKGACLELFTEKDQIIMKKYHSCCVFCGSDENITEYKEKFICESCLHELTDAD